ncbi:hypothetical protein ACFST9_00985 [Hymenobacter monticola]|uniref:Uncharacterized protein n=1 Tax=Hymenobacter monticola TaxID=1705399 RepID=A0ABY4B6R3_9BACT|nr:hypothetical protein [Hymenobacter monticola]UOE33463.1 hypothetical protein MTP16_20345 [Hymenobacter monticola]
MANPIMLKAIPAFIIPFAIVAGLAVNSFGLQSQNGVTKAQAIIQAEEFIKENGYTSTPADKSKLSYELFDGLEKKLDVMLSRRHNTLHPKAFCLSEDEDNWDVGFLSTRVKPEGLTSRQRQSDLPGRAVIVRKDGSGIRMAHKDPLFSHFKKL